MRRYHDGSQIAWVTVVGIAVAAGGAAALAARTGENLVPALVLSAFLLTPALFLATFAVTVTDEEIVLRSGVGLLRTRIPVAAVQSYERLRNKWYYNWAADSPVHGSGFDTVVLSLVDGTSVRIGTNDADALVDALRRVTPGRAFRGEPSQVSHPSALVALLAFLLLPAFVVVAIMFYVSTRTVAVTVSRDQLSISGSLYRDVIPMQEVERISLEPALPEVLQRTNGFIVGDSLRGRFLLQGQGDAHLFVERGSPPYIQVRTTKYVVWVNFKDPVRTRNLYESLISTKIGGMFFSLPPRGRRRTMSGSHRENKEV